MAGSVRLKHSLLPVFLPCSTTTFALSSLSQPRRAAATGGCFMAVCCAQAQNEQEASVLITSWLINIFLSFLILWLALCPFCHLPCGGMEATPQALLLFSSASLLEHGSCWGTEGHCRAVCCTSHLLFNVSHSSVFFCVTGHIPHCQATVTIHPPASRPPAICVSLGCCYI